MTPGRATRRFAPVAVLIASVLLLAGCAGASARASDAAPVRSAEVMMPPSYRFEPSRIQVAAGTTVTFRNTDNFSHTVQVQAQPDRQVKPGESVQIAFNTPGEFPFVCTLHAQNMKGTVLVTNR
jgi:plastocyanin